MNDTIIITRTIKAYHEAGHAVSGHLLGMKVKAVTIEGRGQTAFDGHVLPCDHIMSLFAGLIAESLSPLSDSNLVLHMQDYQDMLRPLASIYADKHGGDPQDTASFAQREIWCDQYREECFAKTNSLLSKPSSRRAITALAELLILHGTVSGEQAEKVILKAIATHNP